MTIIGTPAGADDEAGARSSQLKRAKDELRAVGHKPQPRIIGGVAAADREIPWQAAIVRRRGRPTDPLSIMCGAAFVAPNVLMTAAHCIDGALAGDMTQFEVLNGSASLDGSGMRHFEITEVVGHPRYDAETTDYDFALLRVAQSYDGPVVDLLSPEENQALNVGAIIQVSGWGVTGSGDTAKVMQKADLELVSRSTCNAPVSYGGRITPRMICAGFAKGGKDSCQGDSGGPMVVKTERGDVRLVGVVSWGDGCAQPNKYGVYARLFAARDWIKASIANLSRPPRPVAAATSAPAGVRMIGANKAQLGAFPWQSVIMAKAKSATEKITNRVRCGATFIRNDLLITAAHCAEGLAYAHRNKFVVLNGDGAVELADPRMREYPITDVVVHPRYNRETLDYDFAILRVAGEYKGSLINIVSQSEAAAIKPDLVTRVSGWGYNEKKEATSTLQQADLPVVDTTVCNSKSANDGLITDRMLCAGYQNGKSDACQGDSGGPMMAILADGQPRLIGVVSWGQGCGAKNKYGVYSRLSTVLDWADQAREVLTATVK